MKNNAWRESGSGSASRIGPKKGAGQGRGIVAGLTFGLILGGLVSTALAQATAPPSVDITPFAVAPVSSATPVPNLVEPAVPATYLIGPDDLLDIFVYQMPEFGRQVRVSPNGQIQLPFLAQPIQAGGLTTSTVASAIGQSLVQAELAQAPQVQVTVRQVMSRPIVVAGAVHNPVVLEAVRPMSLLEVLARAGGPDAQAGGIILVSRNGDVPAQTKIYALESLERGDIGDADSMLIGGETVRVVPARLIYAVGALNKPGAFPLQAGEPLTVLKTVSLAEGVRSPADTEHAEIIRTNALGQRVVLPVNLKLIFKHREPDPPLLAGDILYIPDNNKGKVLAAILADAGQAAVIALGYNATKM